MRAVPMATSRSRGCCRMTTRVRVCNGRSGGSSRLLSGRRHTKHMARGLRLVMKARRGPGPEDRGASPPSGMPPVTAPR